MYCKIIFDTMKGSSFSIAFPQFASPRPQATISLQMPAHRLLFISFLVLASLLGVISAYPQPGGPPSVQVSANQQGAKDGRQDSRQGSRQSSESRKPGDPPKTPAAKLRSPETVLAEDGPSSQDFGTEGGGAESKCLSPLPDNLITAKTGPEEDGHDCRRMVAAYADCNSND